MTTPARAKAIYQRLLDEIGAAIEAHDFAAYAPHFGLPHPMQTADGGMIVSTTAQLAEVFERTCTSLALKNVRGLTRICTVAQFADPVTIRGSHETWLVSPTEEIRQSYIALSTLRFINDRWLVTDSQYDGSGNILPSELLKPVPQKPSHGTPT